MKTLPLLKKLLTHQYLAFLLRLYIGGLFIYASMYKINYTAEFAETIANYQLIPYWFVNISAVVLPWVELISGILLITGIRARSASVVLGSLLILFVLGIVVNLLRDSPISCGCFQTVGQKISWWMAFRDIIWVIMTIHVFFFDKVFHLEKIFSASIKEI